MILCFLLSSTHCANSLCLVETIGEGSSLLHSFFSMFDPMADLTNPAGSEDPLAPSSMYSGTAPAGGGTPAASGSGRGGSRYGEELHSVTIRARQRTFYLDLKQSSNGKFVKISEKSRGGQKTTIIFDIEDLPQFVKALQEIQGKV